MREITLHDTLTGGCCPLVPRTPGKVGIYACGPTVYGRIHVGNARPFVVFSLLKRFLVHEGYEVTFVANITDVNDKIYAAAAAAGISSPAARPGDDRSLHSPTPRRSGSAGPTHEPLASETMPAIIELIELLIERGHAYAADGDVYFSVRSYDRYGELSHRQLDELDQGEGRRGSRPQARSVRLRAVEGDQAGRGQRLGVAMGSRAAGLAHRVLGDGARSCSASTSRSTEAART